MGFRFNRRIRILPGVRVNLSKSGVSTSIGGRGAWLTFGKRGTRATVGLPGTGISYTQTLRQHSEHQAEAAPQTDAPPQPCYLCRIVLLVVVAVVVLWAILGR
jgi:hypothetical protein